MLEIGLIEAGRQPNNNTATTEKKSYNTASLQLLGSVAGLRANANARRSVLDASQIFFPARCVCQRKSYWMLDPMPLLLIRSSDSSSFGGLPCAFTAARAGTNAIR